MDKFKIRFLFATSYLGLILANISVDKCGFYRLFPKSAFFLENSKIYVFAQTITGPCLSVLRSEDSGNNRTIFKVEEGYPKIVTDWSNEDFPYYYKRLSSGNVSPRNFSCPPAVLVLRHEIGLVSYLLAQYSITRNNRRFVEWYEVQTTFHRTVVHYLGNKSQRKFENYFWQDVKSERLERFLKASQIHSTILIYTGNLNIGLFNIAYIHDDGKERRKHSFYFKFEYETDKSTFIQNVSRSLHKREAGQFVAYDIPERNASFGYRFIGRYLIPTFYHTDMTEISIMEDNGTFNKEFVKHITKQEQVFIVSSDTWFGCPPFRDCWHLNIDALTHNLEGHALIFSGKYISIKSTKCEIGSDITSAFPDAPDNIDAAFMDDSQNYFLLKDGLVFHYRILKTDMTRANTYKVQDLFHNLRKVTAALYMKQLKEFVYIFTEILNDKESEVWQYEWKNDGGNVQAKLLRKVRISFIHVEMPAVIDAATVSQNEIIIVKDSFYLAIDNVDIFYQSTLRHGTFNLLAGSMKLECNERVSSIFTHNFLKEYFAYQRPKAYKQNETVSRPTITFQTKKFTKPPRFKLLDYIMLISVPFLILAIACSIYWSIPKTRKK